MPLKQGFSKRSVSQNIATERKAGRPEAQSVAIALHTADQAKAHAHTRECMESGGQCPVNLSHDRARVAESFQNRVDAYNARGLIHAAGAVPTPNPPTPSVLVGGVPYDAGNGPGVAKGATQSQ